MPRLAVAGPNPVVTAAARVAGQAGGSVVDTAIVASLVATCTEPGVCAPGSGGFMTIGVPGSDPVVIDGYMTAPGIGYEGESKYRSVSMEYGGGVTTIVDAGSVAVPGSFAAFAAASEAFGVLPWSELMDMSAAAIKDGFPMTPPTRLYLEDSGLPIFSQDPASKQAIFDGGRLLEVGERIRFDDLADTLRYIGSAGVQSLYSGDLARTIVDDLSSRGGSMTREDLSSYRAVMRRPLEVTLGDWRLDTNPAPAVGGVTLAAALGYMVGSGDALDGSVWAESLRSAFRDRLNRLEFAEDRELESERLLQELGMRSPSTIAIAVVGNDGAAASTSFSAGYGSGVVPKGTGMLMNNCLGEIELTPGGMEAQVPGERLLSNMAPTIARSPGQALAVGSPGADRITSALATSISRVLLGGDDLADAIEHPRVHPEFSEEGDRFAAERGLDVSNVSEQVRWFEEQHMYFGGVNGAALLHGDLVAHADSRRAGSVTLID